MQVIINDPVTPKHIQKLRLRVMQNEPLRFEGSFFPDGVLQLPTDNLLIIIGTERFYEEIKDALGKVPPAEEMEVKKRKVDAFNP